jgi:(p)ppGpp synthase/HD superfamily hydrolase
MNKLLGKAIAIASVAFENKVDKGGEPYILHCLVVMNKVRHLGHLAMICAVLHDLIEDCEKNGYNFDVLRELGFSQEVITILELLTHRPETPYMDYIKALSVHPIATAIKKADLEHNSNITRIKGVRKKDFDRLEKYSLAYIYLS